MVKKRLVGCRITRINARKLEDDFLKSRARKPYRTFVEKKSNKHWCVKVQEKK